MPPLASASQLASRLQQDLDTATADLALAGASQLVRVIGRQQIDYVDQETVILLGGERNLQLPERPIDPGRPLTVTELGDFSGGTLLLAEGRDFVRTGNQLSRGYPWWYNGSSRLMGWPWRRLGVWAPRVQVTYSHGYATIPDHIQSLVLDIAQGLYNNPTGLRSLTIDDYTETYALETIGSPEVDAIRKQLGAVGLRRGSFSIRTG